MNEGGTPACGLKLLGKLADIRAILAQHADPARALSVARRAGAGSSAWGVPAVELRRETRNWLAEYRDELTYDEFLTLGELLLDGGRDEEVRIALSFAAAFPGFFTARRFERLGGWLEGRIVTRARADDLCRTLLARFLCDRIVGPEALEPWRDAPFAWKRRAVPVTLLFVPSEVVPRFRQIEIVAPLLGDPATVVRRGVERYFRAASREPAARVEALAPHPAGSP